MNRITRLLVDVSGCASHSISSLSCLPTKLHFYFPG